MGETRRKWLEQRIGLVAMASTAVAVFAPKMGFERIALPAACVSFGAIALAGFLGGFGLGAGDAGDDGGACGGDGGGD